MLNAIFGKKKGKKKDGIPRWKDSKKQVDEKEEKNERKGIKVDEKSQKESEQIEKKLIKKGFAKRGDLIAKVTPAKLGKSGKNVLGEEIPPKEVYVPKLIPLKNVKVEKGNEYYITVDGIVEVFEGDKGTNYIRGTMYRHGRFKVTISNDRMKAFLSVIPPVGGGDPVTVEDVLVACKEKGITHGIDESKIREILEKSLNENTALTDVEIATGKEPVNGEDGKLEIKVKLATGSRFKLKEDGSVDYKEQDLVTSVKKDQLIAVVKKAKPGKMDGFTVGGEVIKCSPGKEIELTPGNNIRTEENNDHIMYYSIIDGQLLFENNRVSVEPQLVINESVGAKTGNINFEGIVIVNGNVNDGYKIEATRGITVSGNVGSAVIKSQGDIIVQNGIVGKHKAHIYANGNVVAKFAENAVIEAVGDVIIQRAVLNCRIVSAGRIISKKEKGQLIGGVLKAKKGLEVKILGNELEHKMEVHAGIDYTVENLINGLKKKIEGYLKAMRKINLLIEKLEKVSGGNPKTLSEKLQKVYMEARKKKTILGIALKKLREKESELIPRLHIIHDAKVLVLESIYPGVRIYFGNAFYDVEERKDRVEFYYDKNLEKIRVKNL